MPEEQKVGDIVPCPVWPLRMPDYMKYCDGSHFEPSIYPELYKVLGTDRLPDKNTGHLKFVIKVKEQE